MLKSGGELKRTLTAPVLTIYGVGTILGAGIYALIGKISGMAGYFAPLSFLGAALVAFLTALSYAELSSRFPKAAGEAVYVFEGFSSKHLGALAGVLVIISGVVSSAALSVGFMGYFGELLDVPSPVVLIAVVLFLGFIAASGVKQAVGLVIAVTAVEVGGLFYILAVGWDGIGQYITHVGDYVGSAKGVPVFGLLSGMILSIYAYIGFEDMANMAEETKEPRKTLGVSILAALLITTILYLLVAMVSLGYLTPDELAASDAPLASVFERATGQDPAFISLISILAITNGALVQIIMSSRVLYGMSREGWVHKGLGDVHPFTSTPVVATVIVSLVYLILALLFPIEALARFAAMVALIVFAMVNLALVMIKVRDADREKPEFHVPAWLPLWGFMACAGCAALEAIWKIVV